MSLWTFSVTGQNTGPVKLAIAGSSHGHVPWILRHPSGDNYLLAAISETNKVLHQKQAKQFQLFEDMFYDNLEFMLESVKPEAVLAFGSIQDHLKVVEACAPRGIHVMVEKPLATGWAEAKKMHALARQYGIHLLVNYETTWYPGYYHLYDKVVSEKTIGNIRRAVFHHGHQGPKEIGVSEEFLAWLTDPDLNGGGALIDFGCYGANMMTWLMQGREPISVWAITQTLKPEYYSAVDDDAIIVCDYGDATAIIQASWNWPMNRKDAEIYGENGYFFSLNRNEVVSLINGKKQSELISDKSLELTYKPFMYFADVIRDKIKMEPYDLSSPENNLVVMKILEAAKISAREGRLIYFKDIEW
ncbi:MAG: Gfo/Idh/MocA family oxidoreductase [Cyclobacteriaceae bacterium]|nr:Gfo/Idh/MocA family oxidoreductase [Cyclobacteriaceae bacterium]